MTVGIAAVGAGEILAVVGDFACGRTLLLDIAARLARPGAARLRPDSAPVTESHPDVGILSREARLFPWLDVAENLAFGLSHLSAFEREGLVANALVRVGLAGCERCWPRDLSGGQRQRVAIARLLIVRPKLVLMDGPFAGLDEETRASLHSLVLAFREESRPAILLATGDVGEAVTLADRILFVQRRTSRIVAGLDNLLARPRDRLSPGFETLEREVRRRLGPASNTAVPRRQVAAEVMEM